MDNWVGFIDGLKELITKIDASITRWQRWINDNKDTIDVFLRSLSWCSDWHSAIEILIDHQFAFAERPTEDFIKVINDSTNIEQTVAQYFFGNDDARMNELILRCEHSTQLCDYNELYTQIITAYRMGNYQIACVALFSILDGLLASMTGLVKETSFIKRFKHLEKKLNEESSLSDYDLQTLGILYALSEENFEKSIFAKSEFDKDEPDIPNRHWIIHGRTRRKYGKIDFLKELLWVEAFIVLSEFENHLNADDAS